MLANKTILVLLTVMSLILAGPDAFASNRIDLTGLSFDDARPTIGDVVRVDTQFYVYSPYSQKVVLSIYVDGKLYEKKTEYLDTGTYKRTSYLDTYNLDRGTYDVKVEVKIYDSKGNVDDTDSKNKYLYVKGEVRETRICYHYYDDYYADYYYDGYCYKYAPSRYGTKEHHLTITQVAYDRSVAAYLSIPFKIYVKNEGDYTETARLSVSIDGQTKETESVLIAQGDERAFILYATAPQATGTYTVRVRASSYYDEHVVEDFIDVSGTTISLNINPADKAKTGEWIHLYGYAMDGDYGSLSAVRIYKDSSYVEQTVPKKTGYYSAYVRFYEPGEHTIRVSAGSAQKTKQIYIEGIAQPAADAIVAGEDPVQDEDTSTGTTTINNYNITNNNITNKYYTVIVLAEENKTVNVDGTDITINVEGPSMGQNGLPDGLEFVDVNVNSKVLNVEQYGGNSLKITVTNRLNEAKVFRIESDFDDAISFVSGPQAVMPGETKTFPIYFSTRGVQGKYEGTISVIQEDKVIKSIPLTVHVVPQRDEQVKTGFNIPAPVAVGAIIAIFALFLAGLFSFARSRKESKESERPLEPRFIPSHIGRFVDKNNKALEQEKKEKRAPREHYEVPWENVVY